MLSTYLIDFENVGNHWAEVLKDASEGDTAVLFYTDNSPKAMLEQLEKIERRGVAIKFRRCRPGRNGLDFQLSSELGYLIGRGGEGRYVIVSDDTGYGVLADYWAQAGTDVSRLGSYASPVTGPDAHEAAVLVLDGPMTELGLTKYERSHVLGCAKACIEMDAAPSDRMVKFRTDTVRIKGHKLMDRLELEIVPILAELFGFAKGDRCS